MYIPDLLNVFNYVFISFSVPDSPIDKAFIDRSATRSVPELTTFISTEISTQWYTVASLQDYNTDWSSQLEADITTIISSDIVKQFITTDIIFGIESPIEYVYSTIYTDEILTTEVELPYSSDSYIGPSKSNDFITTTIFKEDIITYELWDTATVAITSSEYISTILLYEADTTITVEPSTTEYFTTTLFIEDITTEGLWDTTTVTLTSSEYISTIIYETETTTKVESSTAIEYVTTTLFKEDIISTEGLWDIATVTLITSEYFSTSFEINNLVSYEADTTSTGEPSTTIDEYVTRTPTIYHDVLATSDNSQERVVLLEATEPSSIEYILTTVFQELLITTHEPLEDWHVESIGISTYIDVVITTANIDVLSIVEYIQKSPDTSSVVPSSALRITAISEYSYTLISTTVVYNAVCHSITEYYLSSLQPLEINL